ncbi:mechanosensitive ion channel family protein [Enemella dayhoffiae]|nr:mechanosensitive ion channel domain-containing protein [Enemella dayhoffiae]
MKGSWEFPRTFEAVMTWAPVRIVFLLLMAVILRAVAHKLIDLGVRRLVQGKANRRASTPAVGVQRREQRITALGSMARGFATAIICFVILMMIFDELGFNITTIVAGTSVIGVAVAFGVQSIIKDLLSGIFMLVEDQLGVGDYVDMDKASGTVESVGLRVTVLRDDNGNTWYVRNGEVMRVGNFSQGGSDRPVVPEAGAWTLSWSPGKAKPDTTVVKPPEPADGAREVDDKPGRRPVDGDA